MDALVRAFEGQAGFCERLGSPFNAALARSAAQALASGDDLEGLLSSWAALPLPQIADAAVTLRLLGALHDLALSGDAPALSAAYPAPDAPGDPDEAWREGRAAMAAMRERFATFLAHEPQTNEVRRSACLLPGFLLVAAETGLPLRTFELGASAGLNTLWDRYRYRLGAQGWGDAEAPVTLATEWSGPPPPSARVQVVARSACDRRPVDLVDPAQRRRLLAYIWPDMFQRLDALRAAIDFAAEAGVSVEAADALQWARRARPEPGAASVLYHSIFWQYLPEGGAQRLAQLAGELGGTATRNAPFAWLRMEPPIGDPSRIELRLTLWPGGEDRLLAQVHPHGTFVRWGG